MILNVDQEATNKLPIGLIKLTDFKNWLTNLLFKHQLYISVAEISSVLTKQTQKDYMSTHTNLWRRSKTLFHPGAHRSSPPACCQI